MFCFAGSVWSQQRTVARYGRDTRAHRALRQMHGSIWSLSSGPHSTTCLIRLMASWHDDTMFEPFAVAPQHDMMHLSVLMHADLNLLRGGGCRLISRCVAARLPQEASDVIKQGMSPSYLGSRHRKRQMQHCDRFCHNFRQLNCCGNIKVPSQAWRESETKAACCGCWCRRQCHHVCCWMHSLSWPSSVLWYRTQCSIQGSVERERELVSSITIESLVHFALEEHAEWTRNSFGS